MQQEEDTSGNKLTDREVSSLRRWLRIVIVVTVVCGVFSAIVGTLQRSLTRELDPRAAWEEFFGTPEYKSVDMRKPLDEQNRTVEIAGRTLDIQKVYIGNALDKGVVQDGIVLEYVLPEYTSKFHLRTKSAYKEAFNAQRFGHMLIEPEAPRPSFDTMIENRRRHIPKEEHAGAHDGLEHYKWFAKRPEGLIYYYDIYLEKDAGGKIVSFIECAGPEKPGLRFPHCTHKFRDKALLYTLTYNKKNYFAEWREQRRKAIEFIDAFEVTPANNNHGG